METYDIVVLLKLILAHVISDFMLQPKKMVEKKSQRNIYSHIKHASVHAALAYIILFEWMLWYVPLIILTTHFAIDYFKTYCSKNLSNAVLFAADQILHLLVIIALWIIIIPHNSAYIISGLQTEQKYIWAYITGILLLLKPSSVTISAFTEKWKIDNTGLKEAGLWIGYLERLLIFLFIMMSWYEGIGFLLAAKSIFRFGELKNEDLKTTEYVLIGTFASFLIATVIGLLIKSVL